MLPWVLAGLFTLAGLVIHNANFGGYDHIDDGYNYDAWRASLSAFAMFGALAAGLTLDRTRLRPTIIFSVLVGLVMAGIAWRSASAGEIYSDRYLWFFAAVLSGMLAVPLFQAGFQKYRLNTSYRLTHHFGWSDALCLAGSFLFLGASWLLLFILSQLFELIGIEVITQLMEEDWFTWVFIGATFGAALGVLRGQIKIISTLQRVAMLVLSLLAVPMAFALTVFLIAVLFTGFDTLWSATDNATPILLICAAGSFLLVNAILRDDDAGASQSRIMRIAAYMLAIGVFPLALIAAISMGVRIGQYGLSPERIWAMTAIVVAVFYGAAYLFAAIKGRGKAMDAQWAGYIRRSNMFLAILTSAIAMLLALPIFDFGAISTRDQIARLNSGAVSVEDFDFAALRGDFGDAGAEALAGLTKSKNSEIAKLAQEETDYKERHERDYASKSRSLSVRAQIEVSDEKVAAQVLEYFKGSPYRCSDSCRVVELEQSEKGTLMALIEFGEADEQESENIDLVRPKHPQFIFYDAAKQNIVNMYEKDGALFANHAHENAKIKPDAKVELRSYTGRQLHIDGEPIGEPFKDYSFKD